MSITSVQTTMTVAPANGAAGMLYDDGPRDVITRIAAEAIPFGRLVCIASDGTVELPDSAGEVTGLDRGVALHDPTKPTGEGYAAGDPVPVLIAGKVWIEAESGQTIAALTQPYVRHTAGAGEEKGMWRSDADGTDASLVAGAWMLHAATSGGLGVLVLAPPTP